MKAFSIDKNVPLPGMHGVTGTLRRLEVGDSFLIQDASPSHRTQVYHAASRLGIKVSVRVIGANELRVWRVEGGAA